MIKLQNKGAIIIFCLIQILANFVIYHNFVSQQAKQNGQQMADIILWAILSSFLYIYCICRDPGYLQKQQILFLEQAQCHKQQEEQSHQNIRYKASKKYYQQCKYCNIPLYFRQKHCKDCNKCVSTFDHHCTLMAKCIGQKNRLVFYLFLISFQIQLTNAFLIIIVHLFRVQRTFSQINVLSFILIFYGLCTILLVFQTYLMIKNLTTWEYLKSDKIWYLQKLSSANPQKGKYQFNKSTFENLKAFWVCHKKRIKWQDWVIQ